ncbi:MAG: small multi-drug export protein [Clostridia bacterium]|nr:small multi-drug export protein [Clostridia bacterium]
MVPVLELRGSIVLAATFGMSPWHALPISLLGNILPVPFIILFSRKVFRWIRHRFPKYDHLVDRLEAKGKSKADVLDKGIFWGLLIFVGVPLPGTGAWTGALIAAMLDVRLKKAFPPIALGVCSAGLIMLTLSYYIPGLFF